MSENSLDQIPRERGGLFGEPRAERAALPRLLGVSAIEIDLEERL
jgi:hypothetical protein